MASDDHLSDESEDRRSRKKKDYKKEKSRRRDSSDDSADDRNYRRKDKKRKKKHHKKRKQDYSSSNRGSDDGSSASSGRKKKNKKLKVRNERLLAKLAARGETLEERKARREQKRAAFISTKLGYTAGNNPFNDPNLHQAFSWQKRDEKATEKKSRPEDKLEEIEKVRRRRKEREMEREEMDRIRAEENRMKELENYDEWQRKEEKFHLNQQRHRSAIRLLEGREKPIDVLAKNLLMFGNPEEADGNQATNGAMVKYRERYNALEELDSLEAELEEPSSLLKNLKLAELKELLDDIDTFYELEKEAINNVSDENRIGLLENAAIRYWDALRTVTRDEIELLENGGESSDYAKTVKDIKSIFDGQSDYDLHKMKRDVEDKLHGGGKSSSETADPRYWMSVSKQLAVHMASKELSELHSKMLVKQLEKLEKRREELKNRPDGEEEPADDARDVEGGASAVLQNVELGFGDADNELGVTDEVDVSREQYKWDDKYKPRKPRYFNRVKTGYDWNKYNQTHYDQDNPPPKVVQGYKFNIFYPDLIDPSRTPRFRLEAADSDEFCIIRFQAGPPYEDVAFKIINREWNRSRKSGYRCTFERGVLSLYFNFKTHWYRR